MFDLASHAICGLDPLEAAETLARAAEARWGGPAGIAGGLVLATAAAGPSSGDLGQRLAARWPDAALVGTSFEGLLAEGRVIRDEPAVALLAWGHGAGEPVPLILEAGALDGAAEDGADQLAHVVHDAVGPASPGPDDLLLLFPDAHLGRRLEAILDGATQRLGGATILGAGASGARGGPCHAWGDGLDEPGAAIGLWCPGGGSTARWRRASASRFASPWLEIGACRERWVDELDGERALDWVRRQLGLGPVAPIEPHLDRLLVRLRDRHAGPEPEPCSETLDEATDDYVERFVVGLDEQRGAFAVAGTCRRGGRLALALPDAARAREALRGAVAELPATPLLLQLACRARDHSLHGDVDLEGALVAAAAPGPTLGTVAPFQLAPSPTGDCRLLVHSTVLAALGSA